MRFAKLGLYTIKQQKTRGLFKVTNNLTDDVYKVDINTPDCSCKRWKYTKKNRAGIKKLCKHLKICKGIKNNKV